MKRRIIGMLLVVVMLALTLASCGFNYASEDMTEYADFKKDEFVEAIKKLVIDDADFTTNEEIRGKRVLDYVIGKLAAKAGSDKKYEGTIGAQDIFYYNYYATAEVDGAVYTFYGAKMKESDATKLQLGLYDTEADALLAAKVEAGLKAYLNNYATELKVEDFYDTTTSGSVKKDTTVYVSYTYKYFDGDNEVKGSVTYVALDVKEEEGTLGNELIGKSIGTNFSVVDSENNIKPLEAVDVDLDGQLDYGAEVTDVTVHWSVKTGKSFTVEYTLYPSTEGESGTDGTKLTPDMGGEKVQLYGVPLTYYVFPTYYIEVADVNAESIVDLLYGKNLTTTSFDLFTDEELADGVADLYKSAIEEYVAAIKAKDNANTTLTDAKSKVTTAEANLSKAEEGSDKTELEAAVTEAKAKQAEAEADLEVKKGELTAKLNALLAVEENTKDKILTEYKQDAYDSLEDTYNNAIHEALAAEIYKLIDTKVTVNSLPERAVDEAYDTLIEKHKADFYTGSDSESKESYYTKYGDFKSYLTAVKSADSYEDACNKVLEDAKGHVTTYVKIFAVAQGVDQVYTNKEYRKNANTGSLEESYGKINTRVALQFAKLLDYYLELDEDKIKEEDAHGHSHSYIEYVDGKLPYVNLTYTVK